MLDALVLLWNVLPVSILPSDQYSDALITFRLHLFWSQSIDAMGKNTKVLEKAVGSKVLPCLELYHSEGSPGGFRHIIKNVCRRCRSM